MLLNFFHNRGFKVKGFELDRDLNNLLPALKNFYYYKALGNMMHGIIHNLNGSLQLLTMNMEILEMAFKREKLSPSILPYFEKCMEHIDKIRNSLDIIFPGGENEKEANPKQIHLNELLEEQLQFFQNNLFFKHQIKVTKVFKPRLPSIMGYLFDFRIAITNLIQNSIEALEESSVKELTITTKTENEHIQLDIKDTGCGISEDIMPYIFKPFFTTKPESHLGLGLYISKSILQPYGIKIQCNSEKEETVFSLKIPFNRN